METAVEKQEMQLWLTPINFHKFNKAIYGMKGIQIDRKGSDGTLIECIVKFDTMHNIALVITKLLMIVR